LSRVSASLLPLWLVDLLGTQKVERVGLAVQRGEWTGVHVRGVGFGWEESRGTAQLTTRNLLLQHTLPRDRGVGGDENALKVRGRDTPCGTRWGFWRRRLECCAAHTKLGRAGPRWCAPRRVEAGRWL